MGQKICQEIFAITSDNRINIRENEIRRIRNIIIIFIQRRKAIISATNGLKIRKETNRIGGKSYKKGNIYMEMPDKIE